jgi:DNA-binding beta-propeller fold protein YncE
MLTVGPRHLALVAAFAALPFLAPTVARADLLLTRAGTGAAAAIGDGSLAPAAALNAPRGIARLADGSLLIADTGNNKIRKIAPDGTISTVAGTGVAGSTGDTGPALLAQLSGPRDVAVAPDGVSYYVADTGGNRVRFVDGVTGVITAFAGTGTAGATGDGSAATLGTLSGPSGLSVSASGVVYIADTTNNKIRAVTGGVLSTVAGTARRRPRATAPRRSTPPSTRRWTWPRCRRAGS